MKPCTVRRGGMAAAMLVALAAAACEEATGPLTPAERIRTMRTWVTPGQAGTQRVLRAGYAVPVVVRVTDMVGQPVAGATIVWTSPAASGTMSPASSLTNGDGLVITMWTPGTRAGVQELAAAVDGNARISDRTANVVFADTVVGTLVLGAVRDSVAPGDTTRVRITDARDRHGNPYMLFGVQPDNPPPVEFTSLDPAVVGLVSTTGRTVLVTGVAAGTARIVARSGTTADTIALVVRDRPPAPANAPR
jgi:hypothetical protein